ncbi:MAG: ABC-F family ATP-binding cassette domain-containing protein [Myxococcota bacterium]
MGGPVVLSALELRYGIAGRELLAGASLTLEAGERVALVGDNGAGKSTLLALLTRERPLDSGEVRLFGRTRAGLLPQEPRLSPEDTVLAVVQQGLGGHFALLEEHRRLCETGSDGDRIIALTTQIETGAGFDVAHRVEEVLTRLGVTAREEPVGQLSGGERRRCDLARLLLQDPEVLLLDEPTNHLDAAAVKWLAQHLAGRPGGLLFTSHDRAFIDQVATRIVELDEGLLFGHEPPYATFVEGRLLRKDMEGRAADKRKRLLARELAWLRAGTPARTTKQNARIERAEALIAEVKDDVERRQQRRGDLVRAKAERLAKTILELDDVSLAYGERSLFQGLSLTLVEGERWGLVGPNGIGKTSLLRMMTGALSPTTGRVKLGGRTTFAVFDQHRRSLDPEATLDEILADGGDWVFLDGEKVHVCSYLERYLFRGEDRRRQVATLSGGEQNRLLLAKLFQQGANCLVLDEPTNDLDVSTLGLLEDALLDHPGVALIVSHDRRFLDRVCTGILSFAEGKVVAWQGDYTNYERLQAEQEKKRASAVAASSKPQAEAKAEAGRTDRKRKRSYAEQREYETIEARVLDAEAKKEALALSLDEVVRKEPARAHLVAESLAAAELEVETLYARWQELEALG